MDTRRIVLITRRSRYEELLARYHTAAQAKFYLEHLGVRFADYEDEHRASAAALAAIERCLAAAGRVQRVDRDYLPSFLFGPEDLVVVAGPDGLVANALKYVGARALIGVNPDPDRIAGRLLPFRVDTLPEVIAATAAGQAPVHRVTLAQASLSDGQQMLAVNDLFIGCRSHTSARYSLDWNGRSERHSSSGIIVSTGLGSTGWLRSVLTGARAIAGNDEAPAREQLRTRGLAWDTPALVFSVREPFPSPTTGTDLVFGNISAQQTLTITSQMPEDGVIFSDGIEQDRLEFNAGITARIDVAAQYGRLVH